MIAGQKVFITGASSGLGADLAVRLAKAGAVVGICARRKDRLEQVLTECRIHSPESKGWTFDLAVLWELEERILRVNEQMGGIDVLVNNAGMQMYRALVTDNGAPFLSLDDVEGATTLNYLAPVGLTLPLLPLMVARGGGTVVNISSVAIGDIHLPDIVAYCASKSALSFWSETLREAVAERGIVVHTVTPDAFASDMNPGAAIPISVVAESVLALLA